MLWSIMAKTRRRAASSSANGAKSVSNRRLTSRITDPKSMVTDSNPATTQASLKLVSR